MRKKNIILLSIIIIILLPLWMWIAWLFKSKKKLVVAIIDKTVMTAEGQEHVSFDWVLDHEKYTKNKTALYTPGHDYFGFFPGADEHFSLKGLERFSSSDLSTLSHDADMVYFTDTYGVYKNEWYKKSNNGDRSGKLYGGMSRQDIDFLQNMKDNHKLILTEFNAIGSPTPTDIRKEFEAMFDMKWTGWTAKYFSSLDTLVNLEIPGWLIVNYSRQHNGQWPFHNAGIAFLSNTDQVEILDEATQLTDPVPSIESTPAGQHQFNIPASIKYPFWFDIIDPGLAQNAVAANFVIHANGAGKALLNKYNIPLSFPAVLFHQGNDYNFYYFSGDFCDNPISCKTADFSGVQYFKWLFYNSADVNQRGGFFWNFYRPMMTNILSDYYNHLHKD